MVQNQQKSVAENKNIIGKRQKMKKGIAFI
jgi:hypothetical protein